MATVQYCVIAAMCTSQFAKPDIPSAAAKSLQDLCPKSKPVRLSCNRVPTLLFSILHSLFHLLLEVNIPVSLYSLFLRVKNTLWIHQAVRTMKKAPRTHPERFQRWPLPETTAKKKMSFTPQNKNRAPTQSARSQEQSPSTSSLLSNRAHKTMFCLRGWLPSLVSFSFFS